jgi:hypothetical protein
MPAITLKNIPDDLYKQIKKSAKLNYRSLNAEILFRLKQSLGAKSINNEAFLARIEVLRSGTEIPPLTGESLEKAKSEGRE